MSSGDIDRHGNLAETLGEHVHTWDVGVPKPGETCEACKRKVPHPRRESSPTSKTFAYRVPTDEAVAHQELLDEAARFVGVAEQPFERFRLLALAVYAVLQDESMRDFARRAA